MTQEDLGEFIQKKGGAELIFAIEKDRGSIQKEIAKIVNISEPNLSNKLDIAIEVGLLEETRLAGDHGNAKRYQLTTKGSELHTEFEERGLISKYNQKRELESDINSSIEDISGELDDILKGTMPAASQLVEERNISDEEYIPESPSNIDADKIEEHVDTQSSESDPSRSED